MTIQLDVSCIVYLTDDLKQKYHERHSNFIALINQGVTFSLVARPLREHGLISPREAFMSSIAIHKGHSKAFPLPVFLQACNGQVVLPYADKDWYNKLHNKDVHGPSITTSLFITTMSGIFPNQFKGIIQINRRQ